MIQNIKPEEEKLLRLLERMTEEGSDKFALIPLSCRYYLADERPPDWRYQLIDIITSLSRRVRKQGGVLKKFKHPKIKDAYMFSGLKGLLDD